MGIATRVRAERSRVRIPVRVISLSKASSSAHPASFTKVTGFFLLNIRKHLNSSCAGSGNEWSCTSSLFLWVYGVFGDNFTFAADEVEEGEAFVFGAFSEHSQSSRLLFV